MAGSLAEPRPGASLIRVSDPTAYVPFFQGHLDQVKELQGLCTEQGLKTTPMEPPGGCGKG